nr:MAG TPA: hypothetical protein [Crassvirales sp.]
MHSKLGLVINGFKHTALAVTLFSCCEIISRGI